jgi:hypothetical protein
MGRDRDERPVFIHGFDFVRITTDATTPDAY